MPMPIHSRNIMMSLECRVCDVVLEFKSRSPYMIISQKELDGIEASFRITHNIKEQVDVYYNPKMRIVKPK